MRDLSLPFGNGRPNCHPTTDDGTYGQERADLHTRTRRLILANDAHNFRVAADAKPICVQRSLTGKQFVEKHSQRIDIASRVDSQPAHLSLLGTHVSGRTDHLAIRGINRFLGQVLAESLRNAEVDDLDDRFTVMERDQNVRRFQIAMDDPLLMSMLNRSANVSEQLHPLAGRQTIPVAEFRDIDALNEFHNEVWPSTVLGLTYENFVTGCMNVQSKTDANC